eukprot:SAG22_NODE_3451_length_1705_cov_1.250934_2_plen_127_part_00
MPSVCPARQLASLAKFARIGAGVAAVGYLYGEWVWLQKRVYTGAVLCLYLLGLLGAGLPMYVMACCKRRTCGAAALQESKKPKAVRAHAVISIVVLPSADAETRGARQFGSVRTKALSFCCVSTVS